MNEFQRVYRRHLPHYQLPGATLFLTYRLFGSLPKTVLLALKQERDIEELKIQKENPETDKQARLRRILRKRLFLKWEHVLDRCDTGPTWLKVPEVAELVCNAIHHRHPGQYKLLCFCIMPNHVHQVIVHTHEELAIYKVLESLKRYTATRANRILGRTGHSFWQDETFDHVIRIGKLHATVQYVLNNPVKAGLVSKWSEWPYSWVDSDLQGQIDQL